MKLICTPLTLEAMKLLDTDDCPESSLESISLTDREYQQLWKSGILQRINAALEKTIDDYEDEDIRTLEDLKKTLNILESSTSLDIPELIKNIVLLNKLAIERETGLYFFF